MVLVAFSVLDVALHLFKVNDLYRLAQGMLWTFSTIFFTYAVRHITLNVGALNVDVGAALLVGKLNLKAVIELATITLLVYAGIRVAPLIASYLVSG